MTGDGTQCGIGGLQTLARGANLACGAFSNGPHGRVIKKINVNFLDCQTVLNHCDNQFKV